MSKLPVISGGKYVKALQQIGFEVNRQRGSHIILMKFCLARKVLFRVGVALSG